MRSGPITETRGGIHVPTKKDRARAMQTRSLAADLLAAPQPEADTTKCDEEGAQRSSQEWESSVRERGARADAAGPCFGGAADAATTTLGAGCAWGAGGVAAGAGRAVAGGGGARGAGGVAAGAGRALAGGAGARGAGGVAAGAGRALAGGGCARGAGGVATGTARALAGRGCARGAGGVA